MIDIIQDGQSIVSIQSTFKGNDIMDYRCDSVIIDSFKSADLVKNGYYSELSIHVTGDFCYIIEGDHEALKILMKSLKRNINLSKLNTDNED